jgi:DNA repair protein RecO (recombination protein O)
LYWTSSFILQKSDAYEHDKILDVFTKEWGRTEVAARGTRKIDSKLNPHLGLLDEIMIGMVRGSSRWVLVDAQLLHSFSSKNPEAYKSGFSILEIARRLLWPDLPEADVFETMRDSLSSLESLHIKPRAAPLMFWGRSLSQLGYQPKFEQCAICGSTIDEIFGFSLRQRGAVCKKCGLKTEEALILHNNSSHFWNTLREWFLKRGELVHNRYDLSEIEYASAEKLLNKYTAEVIPEI